MLFVRSLLTHSIRPYSFNEHYIIWITPFHLPFLSALLARISEGAFAGLLAWIAYSLYSSKFSYPVIQKKPTRICTGHKIKSNDQNILLTAITINCLQIFYFLPDYRPELERTRSCRIFKERERKRGDEGEKKNSLCAFRVN